MSIKFGILVSTALLSGLSVSEANTMAALQAASGPHVKWDAKSAVRADVTCDGKPDTIAVGRAKGPVVWIGVVSASQTPSKQDMQLFHFPAFETSNQDAFCSLPVSISHSPMNCRGEGGALSGCKVVRGCFTFDVGDGQCDSFHFYWDSRHHKLAYWRL